MLHYRQNCERKKLQALGVKKNKRRIIRAIYGEQIDNVCHQGLVDSESPQEYDENLLVQNKLWEQLKVEDTDKPAQFYDWFVKHKSKEVRAAMLKPLRLEAGIGESQYTTND